MSVLYCIQEQKTQSKIQILLNKGDGKMSLYKECKENGHYDGDITIQALIQRDGDKCYLCNKEVEFSNNSYNPRHPNIEHVIPRSKGGTHSWDNVKVACRDCNVRKNNRYVGIFVEELNARKKQKLINSIKGRVNRSLEIKNSRINLDNNINVFNQHKKYKDNLDNILDGNMEGMGAPNINNVVSIKRGKPKTISGII